MARAWELDCLTISHIYGGNNLLLISVLQNLENIGNYKTTKIFWHFTYQKKIQINHSHFTYLNGQSFSFIMKIAILTQSLT